MFERYKLTKRVDELQDMVSDLTRLVKARDLDWEDMRARCKRLLDRTEKAARRVVESEQGNDAGEPVVAAAPESVSGNGRLSPHQIEVQQKILRRRAGWS